MRKATLVLGLSAIVAAPAMAADAAKMDWSAVPKSEIVLFYPGQASLEFVTGGVHPGAAAVKSGANCLTCHKGQEAAVGGKMVSGKPVLGQQLEPNPIPGKPATVKVTAQAAYDQNNLYMKFTWPAKNIGEYHVYAAYKDGKWGTYADHRSNKDVASGKLKVSYEDRFTIMLGDGKNVPEFNDRGCWVTCHNDMRDMPNEPKSADVKAHPILGDSGMKKSDIRKYLPESRTAMGPTGGWDKIKSKAEIDAIKAEGNFLELWQWRAYRSNPVNMADDGYVLEYRNSDAGKNPFFNNWDGAKHQPRFMFDPAKNQGRAGLTEAEFRDPKAPQLTDKNRVPYDPNYAWKNGDLMVEFGIDTSSSGSAADNKPVVGTYANGTMTLLWTRKLDTGNKDDIALKAGATYPIGLAVHDDNVTTRFHHVSFPLKLSLGKKDGQINAVEVK